MAEAIFTDARASAANLATAAPAAAKGESARLHQPIKRLFDILAALGGLIFFLPIMLVVAVLISLQDGGPILFAQERIGREGRTFRCFKFRTMVVDAQARLDALLASDPAARLEWAKDHKLKRDPRITALGAFLRKSSLDEIPQLLNIMKGDMSVVGPRPIVAAEIKRYGPRFVCYCQVRPGLTGLWQVGGRNNTTYRRRVAMDTLYAKKRTLAPDLWVVVMTVPAVLMSRGSY